MCSRLVGSGKRVTGRQSFPAVPLRSALACHGLRSPSLRKTGMNESLLCVANFRTSTGYAWNFINELYAAMGRRAAARGMRTWVAYWEVNSTPPALRDGPARPVQLDARFRNLRSIVAVLRFVRRERVRIVYMSDRPASHFAYILLRLAGVRRIVVHFHLSGARGDRSGVRRLYRRIRHRLPGCLADAVVAVSDHTANYVREVRAVPRRVRRVWNSTQLTGEAGARALLRATFQIAPDRLVVGCACRADEGKGVQHLLRAFEALHEESGLRPVLVYFGAGPALEAWQRLRDSLSCAGDVILAGYRTDAARLMGGVDVAVVPSVCLEAFGMAALESMAKGVPVVASRIGGLPEVIADGTTGILVPPGDEAALRAAMERLLRDPAERRRVGNAGRERASRLFSRERALAELEQLVFG